MRAVIALLVLLVLWNIRSFADTVVAASCSDADVQTAVDAALDGDIVSVPAGSCSWTTAVSVPSTKGVILQGAGIGQTIITNGGIISTSTLSLNIGSGNSATRVTGFTFDANGVTKSGVAAELAVGAVAGALDSFRIDHNAILNVRSRGIVVGMNGYDLGGVIDNTTIEAPFAASAQGISIIGAGAEVGTPFDRALTLGTNHAIYIEDSTFNYDFANDGAYDAYGGARMVFRKNTVSGASRGHHGADSGTYRGIVSMEDYLNQASNPPAAIRASFWRSGTGAFFGNTYTGTWGALEFTIYRARTSSANFLYWGTCDGTAPWDSNATGMSGYPCIDQPGHFFGSSLPLGAGNPSATLTTLSESGTTVTANCDATCGFSMGQGVVVLGASNYQYNGAWIVDSSSGTQFTYTANASGFPAATSGTAQSPVDNSADTLRPLYVWNNTKAGVQLDASVDGSVQAGYLTANVDFYNEDSSFDGTTGVGVGVIASQPATCTTGVGYWATDEGEWDSTNGATADGRLYKCPSTDTWELFYTPFTYPHPLQGPVINTTTLPAGEQSMAYSEVLSVTGVDVTCAVTSGAMPAEFTLSTVTISGTTASNGVYNFTVTCTDWQGETDAQALSLTINAAGGGAPSKPAAYFPGLVN